MIGGWGIFCKIVLRWMLLDLTDDKSTLVQVMAWWHQAKAITWANVDPDLCRHMASLGHNELIYWRKTLPGKVIEYLESTFETLGLDIWFVGNGLAPITVKYCYFNATLMCSIVDERKRYTIECTEICNFWYLYTLKTINNFQSIRHYIMNLCVPWFDTGIRENFVGSTDNNRMAITKWQNVVVQGAAPCHLVYYRKSKSTNFAWRQERIIKYVTHMMTSSNGYIFRVTGPLWWEFTCHRGIPLTKASDAELWCFHWSALEKTVE